MRVLMINVAIVDDDEKTLEQTRACIEHLEDLPEEVEVKTFSSGEDFLEKLKPGEKYDVLFTDIQMTGMNGLELGAAAHKKFPHIYLIFLTSFTHYAVDSYIVDAYQYILKQQMGERIPPVMRKMILEIQRERKKFRIIEAVNDTQKIFYQDIIYIKKVKGSKYVEYMTLHGNYRERIPIDQLMKELNSMEFIFVERSFIVNIEHIIRLKGNIVYMENGDEITISRGRLSDVKMTLSKHWGNL